MVFARYFKNIDQNPNLNEDWSDDVDLTLGRSNIHKQYPPSEIITSPEENFHHYNMPLDLKKELQKRNSDIITKRNAEISQKIEQDREQEEQEKYSRSEQDWINIIRDKAIICKALSEKTNLSLQKLKDVREEIQSLKQQIKNTSRGTDIFLQPKEMPRIEELKRIESKLIAMYDRDMSNSYSAETQYKNEWDNFYECCPDSKYNASRYKRKHKPSRYTDKDEEFVYPTANEFLNSITDFTEGYNYFLNEDWSDDVDYTLGSDNVHRQHSYARVGQYDKDDIVRAEINRKEDISNNNDSIEPQQQNLRQQPEQYWMNKLNEQFEFILKLRQEWEPLVERYRELRQQKYELSMSIDEKQSEGYSDEELSKDVLSLREMTREAGTLYREQAKIHNKIDYMMRRFLKTYNKFKEDYPDISTENLNVIDKMMSKLEEIKIQKQKGKI